MYKPPTIQQGDLASHIGKLKRTGVGPVISPVGNPGNEYVENNHPKAPLTTFARNKPPPPNKPNKPIKVPLPELVHKTDKLVAKPLEKPLEKKPLEKPRVPVRTDSIQENNLKQFNLRKTGIDLRQESEERDDTNADNDAVKKSVGKLDLNKFSSLQSVGMTRDSKPSVTGKNVLEKTDSFPPPPPSLLEEPGKTEEGDEIYDDVEAVAPSKTVTAVPPPQTSSKPKLSPKPSPSAKPVAQIPIKSTKSSQPSVDLNNNSATTVSQLIQNNSFSNGQPKLPPGEGYIEEDIYDDVESSHMLTPVSMETKSAAGVLEEEDIYDDVESHPLPSSTLNPEPNVLAESGTFGVQSSHVVQQSAAGTNHINGTRAVAEDIYDDVDGPAAQTNEAVEEEIYDDIDPADVLGPTSTEEVYDDVAGPPGSASPYPSSLPQSNLNHDKPIKTFGLLDESRFVVPPGLTEWMLAVIAANPPKKPKPVNHPAIPDIPIRDLVIVKRKDGDTSSITSTDSKDKMEKDKKKEAKKKDKEKKAREAQLKKDLKVFGVDASAERPILGSVIATTEVKGTKKELAYRHGDELNVIRTSHKCPTDKCLAQNITTNRIGYISKEEFGLGNIDDLEPAGRGRTLSLIPTNDSDDENDGIAGESLKGPPPVPNGPRPSATLPAHPAPFVPIGTRRPCGSLPPQPPPTLRTFQSQPAMSTHGRVVEELYDDVANGGGEIYDDVANGGGEIYEDIGEGLSTKNEFIQQEDIYDSIA